MDFIVSRLYSLVHQSKSGTAAAAAKATAIGAVAPALSAVEHVAVPVTETVPSLVVPVAHATQALLLG